MNGISDRELYCFYKDVLCRCTSDLLNRSDEEIEYELFEEFDVGAHSFLHDETLVRLRQSGYIDEAAVAESKEIRRKWFTLQTKAQRTSEIRESKEWRELFDRCDQLRRRLERSPHPSD